MVLHHKTILEGSLDSQVDPRKVTKQFVLLVTLQSYLPFPWGTVRAQHGLPHPHFLLHKIYVYQRQSLGETWAGGLGPDTGLLLCLLFSLSGQPGTKGVAVKHQSPGAPVRAQLLLWDPGLVLWEWSPERLFLTSSLNNPSERVHAG